MLVSGLHKPDGLVHFQGGIAYSQEGGTHPVNWLFEGQIRSLFEGTNVQGLEADGSAPIPLEHLNEPSFLKCDARGLWISEDATHRARLLLLNPQGRLETVLSHLRAPQVLLPSGTHSYLLAEGGRNRILEIRRSE
ncbi:hypothetical protein [Azotobacter chroococcum]|uniref:hypothetical protein n=1 Tax=Azotobacter chroococcum TaxID=353 RepID=UPI001E56F8CD|nr:hypothetical protein [Azotobacter chroococcum]